MGQLTVPGSTQIGTAVIGGTVNSVLFVGAGGLLAEDNANLWWDNTTKEFNALNGIFGEPGTEAGGITVDGVLYSSHLKSSDINDSDVAHFIVHRHSLTLPPIIVTSRSHSAGAGHAIVQNGDGLGQWYAVGWDGTDYAIGGTAGFFVDGVPGNNDMPTRFVVALSPNGTQTPVDRLTIKENGQLLVSDGTAANPAYAFANSTNTGLVLPVAGTIDIAISGATVHRFNNDYNNVVGSVRVTNNAGELSIGAASDVRLFRDAADTLAQRNGVNAQTFNIYNTFTNAADYERLSLNFTSNIARLVVENAGTGLGRSLQIGTLVNNTVQLVTNSGSRWEWQTTGHQFAVTDNIYDIGATGANRPRSLFLGTSLQIEADQGLRLTNQVSGAAAAAGTLLNAPAAGNPTFWAPIFVNGGLKYFPCW